MNGTRKMLLSLCAILLLTFGVFACKSSSSTTGQNTAGLNNSTGAYTGGSQEPQSAENVSAEARANTQMGSHDLNQAQSADTSYSGTGQTLVQSNAQKSASTTTTTTTTYSTPTVVQTAPTVVQPNTTETVVTTPVTTAEVTTPTVTETQTTTTETTAPMTSSTQESTTTTTTPTETTTTTHHRRMHKD